MEGLQIHYGKAAERIRREKEIPVKTIAERMDSSLSTVYELFKKPNIKTDVLYQLANALEVEPDELLSNTTSTDEKSLLLAENKELRKQVAELTETVKQLVQLLGKPKGSSLLATA